MLCLLGSSLNPLLIGAQCELRENFRFNFKRSLNPLLIGAQCEHAVVFESYDRARVSIPF